MIFASDNWAGAHPKIAAGLSAHASGFDPAYGSGELDKAVHRRFCEIFERDVAVFFVATGTAANAISMSACNRVGGVAFCHAEAHMTVDEFGAMGFFTGGARTAPVPGASGRIDPQALDRAITRFSHDLAPAGQPMAVTITQATEIGTVYSLDDIATVSAVAKKHGLPLHMDGARFANALVALDVAPAEMTWKRGVDIVSFGGTKNGCWMAEAIVVLNPQLGGDLQVLRQRAGQLFSKSRFMAAQFDTYLADGLWLETARRANAMAARLADVVRASEHMRLAWEPQANEVFAILGREKSEQLRAAGARFHEWGLPQSFDGDVSEGEAIYRFVTSFATTAEDVDRLRELVG
jgi:threonine aldolase